MSEGDEIGSRARQLHAAWATSDREVLATLLADVYHHVDIYGQVFDRDAFLEYASEPRSPGTLRYHDEDVAEIGDVGVLTSTLGLDDYDGGIVIRLTQVFVRSEDGWRRRWYQATQIRTP